MTIQRERRLGKHLKTQIYLKHWAQVLLLTQQSKDNLFPNRPGPTQQNVNYEIVNTMLGLLPRLQRTPFFESPVPLFLSPSPVPASPQRMTIWLVLRHLA